MQINFKVEGNLPVNSINVLQQGQTLFLDSFLALSVDHEISKFYKNDENFNKFKQECSKTGTTEEAIAVGEKLDLKLILKPLIHLTQNKKFQYILQILF